MWLLKVGEYNHLESFRQGFVHFNPLSLFRRDGTLFRGDTLEGTYIIDMSKGFYIDGIDFGKFGGHTTLTHADSDDVLIFCAAILDNSNSQPVAPNVINLFDEFASEMRKFGKYAVVFELKGFMESIQKSLSDVKCNTAWSKVEYCNKENHEGVRQYISKAKERLGDTAIYFLKDESYKHQNEWRYIIDYINPNARLILNENKSLDLKISSFPVSQIIDLDSATKISEL